ncbi:hypothetical protein BCV72DRAFT_303034 [Rhizopus microsporus var. microsporus]|nr:hypothetical protein BCV72DRAFT_303034 [Rhizopus microsporus var. microsporus]
MRILILLSLLITLTTALKINNKQALAQLIASQIRTRIQSDLVFKISASITQTMKTHVSVQLEISQGMAQIQQRHIETAAATSQRKQEEEITIPAGRYKCKAKKNNGTG